MSELIHLRKPVFIFGASLLGRSALESLNAIGVEVHGYFDNDTRKQGTFCDKLLVRNISIYEDKLRSISIVVASQFSTEIIKQLFGLGCEYLYKFQPTSVANRFLFIPLEPMLGASSNREIFCVSLVSNYSGSNTLCLAKSDSFKSLEVTNRLINPEDLDAADLTALRVSSIALATHHFNFFEALNTMQFWHGFPLKTLGWWNKSINTQAMQSLSAEWSSHSAIFSYSRLYSSLIDTCFRGNPSTYQVTGMPRNDMLLRVGARQNLAQLTGVKLDGLAVGFWLPTFRETFFGSKTGQSIRSELPNSSVSRIVEVCESHDILLVIKNHPYERSPLIFPESKNIVQVSNDDLEGSDFDLYEVLGAADFLITDYSSVYFDYLLLDRPILFFQIDRDEYDGSRGFLIDEDVDFWCPGERISTFEELESAFISVVKGDDPFYADRRNLCRVVHQFQDASSCERVSHLIQKYLCRYA